MSTEGDNNNTTPTAVEIHIVWQNIVIDFYDSFNQRYQRDKKAHFDCVPSPYALVDGARVKWSIPLLLDALVYFYENEAFKIAVRREFNQQRVLADCLLREMNRVLNSLDDESSTPIPHENTMVYVHMVPIEHPWNSLEDVRNILLQCPPSKSTKKYSQMVDVLTERLTSIMGEFELPYIIKSVVSKLLCNVSVRSANGRPIYNNLGSEPNLLSIMTADRIQTVTSRHLIDSLGRPENHNDQPRAYKRRHSEIEPAPNAESTDDKCVEFTNSDSQSNQP
eukprot:scaffold504_cov189-Ochromonas_danica.AAC.1